MPDPDGFRKKLVCTHSDQRSYNFERELAAKIWALVNPGVQFPDFKHLPAPASDVRFRVGVSEKAKKLLGWTPKHGLDYILEDTFEYVKAHTKPGASR